MTIDKEKILSRLTLNYPSSGIRAMFDLARQYPGAVNTCNGEPNFITPRHIIDAAVASLHAGETKYSVEPGLMEMREAVARKMIRQYGDAYPYDVDNVMITLGGCEGIMLSLMTLINPGDEVIIPDPAYTCYEGQVLTLGGKVIRVPLKEEYGFKLQPEDLEAAITPKTRVLIINYPNNPLGAVLTKEDGEKLADVILKHNLMVLSDEVYESIVFDGRTHFSLQQIERIRDHVIIVNSLSKTYAMTGWRLGYNVGTDKDIMKHMFKMQQAIVSVLPVFTMRAGAAALDGPQDCVEDMRKEYESRRNHLVDGLNRIPGYHTFRTEGSFCCFINIKELGKSSWELSKELLINAGVMTVGGHAFGSMGEGFLRICFANSDDVITEALKRLYKYYGIE